MARLDWKRRLLGYAVGLGVPGAALSPVFSGAPDSFPLSTYPMFARPRGQPILYAVVALAANGAERRVPPAMLGSKEVLQAKVLIQRSVDGGMPAMTQLCREAAARLAADAAHANVRVVRIVRRRYDPIGYFVSGPMPIEEHVLCECSVPASVAARSEPARGQP